MKQKYEPPKIYELGRGPQKGYAGPDPCLNGSAPLSGGGCQTGTTPTEATCTNGTTPSYVSTCAAGTTPGCTTGTTPTGNTCTAGTSGG